MPAHGFDGSELQAAFRSFLRSERDHEFESTLLEQGVRCEADFREQNPSMAVANLAVTLQSSSPREERQVLWGPALKVAVTVCRYRARVPIWG